MGIQKSPSQYRKELKAATDGALIVLEDYRGARTKIKHRCLKCRWEWSCEPSNVLSHGSRCPKCAGQVRLTQKDYLEELRDRKIKVLGLYVNRKTKVLHRCLVCTYEWEAIPDNVGRKGSGCPACAHETRNRSFKGRQVRINGRTYRLQGFEHHALRYMKERGANLSKLAFDVADGKPTVKYWDGDRTRLYIPDFYYAPKNRIIEVKSLWTLLGRFEGNDMFAKNKRKAKACKKQGFGFCMLVFDNEGQRVQLPRGWERMSLRDFNAACLQH